MATKSLKLAISTSCSVLLRPLYDMLVFINVPERSKEFTDLKHIEGDNSVLKIKKKRQTTLFKSSAYFKNHFHNYFYS